MPKPLSLCALRPFWRAALPVLAGLLAHDPAFAQSASGPLCSASPAPHPWGLTYELDAARVAAGSHPRHLTRTSDQEARCPGVAARSFGLASFAARPVVLETELHSGYPDDRNNGLRWAGRGWSGSVSGGVVASVGPVRAGIVPTFAYQENLAFSLRSRALPGYSEFVNGFYNTIDLPQRFGGDSFRTTSLGQSFIRVDARGLTAGLSTENIVVGPALRNPVLLSSSGAGFPHLFIGTSRPADLWIATLNLQLVAGRLSESDYFDTRTDNDHNRLALLVLSVTPRWLDGLEVGIARAYMSPTRSSNVLGDAGALLQYFGGGEGNLPGNELASFFARWVLPESRAEFYAEWARDDRFSNLVDDLIPEPDHSQAYTLGFQKLTPVGSRLVRVSGELTHLQEKQEVRTGRPLPIYYTHQIVTQGYTHQGQLLGAGIGPGADAQFVAIDLLDDVWLGSAFIERVRRNDASEAAVSARYAYPYEHDTELTGGVRARYIRSGVSFGGTLAYSMRWDRDFVEDDESFGFATEVVWWPGF